MKKVLFVLPSLPHYREDLINGIDDYLTNYNISVYAGFGSSKKYIKAATLKKSIALAVLKEGKKLKGQKLLVPMIDKTIKVTVSDTVFLDKENERING